MAWTLEDRWGECDTDFAWLTLLPSDSPKTASTSTGDRKSVSNYQNSSRRSALSALRSGRFTALKITPSKVGQPGKQDEKEDEVPLTRSDDTRFHDGQRLWNRT